MKSVSLLHEIVRPDTFVANILDNIEILTHNKQTYNT